MAPYTHAQKMAIQQFRAMTGSDQTVAIQLLKNARWNLQIAVNTYFDMARYPPGTPQPNISALSAVFDKYRDDPKDSPDKIGIEGTMSYLNDIDVPLDEVVCLGIAQLLQSETIGEFKRDKFIDGWKRFPACSTIEAMKQHAQGLRLSIPKKPSLYRTIYRYTFPVSRMPPARTLPLEIAVDQWQMLFTSEKGGINMNTPTTPWLDWWLEFVKTKHKRPINKDLWEQIEVFLESAKKNESLEWHSEDGAWPGAIDEFVVFVKEKRGQSQGSGGANSGDTMEVE